MSGIEGMLSRLRHVPDKALLSRRIERFARERKRDRFWRPSSRAGRCADRDCLRHGFRTFPAMIWAGNAALGTRRSAVESRHCTECFVRSCVGALQTSEKRLHHAGAGMHPARFRGRVFDSAGADQGSLSGAPPGSSCMGSTSAPPSRREHKKNIAARLARPRPTAFPGKPTPVPRM
jgi:hypothetical protein